MWQTFVDSINPLTKILHAPTVQQQVLDASSNLEKISKGTEALLFSIYACAVVAMNDEECKTNFGEERSILLSRYQAGARKALIKAGFLRSSNLIILQAYVLYLVGRLIPSLHLLQANRAYSSPAYISRSTHAHYSA